MQCLAKYGKAYGCHQTKLTLPPGDKCAGVISNSQCLGDGCQICDAKQCSIPGNVQCASFCGRFNNTASVGGYCAPGCRREQINDGECQMECVTEGCLFDGQDCGNALSMVCTSSGGNASKNTSVDPYISSCTKYTSVAYAGHPVRFIPLLSCSGHRPLSSETSPVSCFVFADLFQCAKVLLQHCWCAWKTLLSTAMFRSHNGAHGRGPRKTAMTVLKLP